MQSRGFSNNILLAVIGVVIVIGIAAYSALNINQDAEDVVMPVVPGEGEDVAVYLPPENSVPAAPSSKPPTGQSGGGTISKPSSSKPPASGGTATQPTPMPTPAPQPVPEETTPAPAPQPEPTPSPAPYNPGFLAASRVTPEIPSENERATLPSCEGKLFTLDPVNLSNVSNITTSGSQNSGGVSDHTILQVLGTGELNKYAVYAPGDVWITHIAQETGISADPEDTTIYFALCRDVIGYISHIKELSADMYKIITDSECLGKPHTGPNACKIEVLKQVGVGSSFGKVGRFEGKFDLGVIDLRKERGLPNASGLPIKTNFAACPFSYFVGSTGYFAKHTGGSSLCMAP